jgi:hypothetical protein
MLPCRVAHVPLGLVAAWVLCAQAACGGSSPVLRAPSAAAISRGTPGPATTADLGPVALPANLIVFGRITKPSASLSIAHAWSKLPTPQSEQLSELVVGEPVGPLIDVDQPVDFALAVNRPGGGPPSDTALFSVSAGIRDLDVAKAALTERYKLVPADNGALVIQGLGTAADSGADEEDRDSQARRTCELAPAYGSSATRLVCALGDPKALTELGPWLTRGATRMRSTSDVRVDVRVQPMKSLVSDKWKTMSILLGAFTGSSLGIPSVRELAMAAAQDLVNSVLDLDTLSLDLHLSDSAARVVLTQNFSGTTSLFAQLATANADRVGPPPAQFWQMPSDADLAVFGRGTDPALLAPIRDRMLKVVSETLAEDGVKSPDGRALVEALRRFPLSTATVYAHGIDVEAARKSVAVAVSSAGDESEQTARWSLAKDLVGWHVVEMDEPASDLSQALKALTAAWSRPAVASVYRAGFRGLPAVRLAPAPMPKGGAWPVTAEHYVVELQPPPPAHQKAGGKTQPAARSVTFHVFVVPDGGRTWVGVGGDESLITAKLASAIAGSGDSLRSMSELMLLKDSHVGAAGFVTIRGVATEAMGIAALVGMSPQSAADTLAELQRLPAAGASALTLTSTSSSSKAPAAVVTSFDVPRAAVEDGIVWALHHGGF